MSPATPPHIGLFDSGIGGLSVLRAVRHRLPWARLSYIADSRYTPWGDRPVAWVVERSLQLSAHLLAQQADLVLVACNTATTLAIAALRARWPAVRFVGVEPGIKPAVAASRHGRVAVLATSATLGSGRLEHLAGNHAAGITLLRLPCPGLAEAIEGAGLDDAALDARLDDIAAHLRQADIDTVVLGCTHYPLVADALARRLGPQVVLVDTADAVANRVASLLAADEGEGRYPAQTIPTPRLRLLSTGSCAGLQRAARHWLSEAADVEAIQLPELTP